METRLQKIISKKAALELSVSTIVVIVFSASMLILGLILIMTIFTGSKYNVDIMNKKVESEIGKLFAQDQRAVIYLPDNKIAEVKQGDDFGLGFGIQNTIEEQRFEWKVQVADKNKCNVSDRDAESWIVTGSSGNVDIPSGRKYIDIIRYNIPKSDDISKCTIKYKLVVEQEDGTPFTIEPFFVEIGKVDESNDEESVGNENIVDENDDLNLGSCNVDVDCKILDKEMVYGCCWTPLCPIVDYSLDTYIAVNKESFLSLRKNSCPAIDTIGGKNKFEDPIPRDHTCGPAPGCPAKLKNLNYAAKCIKNKCTKVLLVNIK